MRTTTIAFRCLSLAFLPTPTIAASVTIVSPTSGSQVVVNPGGQVVVTYSYDVRGDAHFSSSLGTQLSIRIVRPDGNGALLNTITRTGSSSNYVPSATTTFSIANPFFWPYGLYDVTAELETGNGSWTFATDEEPDAVRIELPASNCADIGVTPSTVAQPPGGQSPFTLRVSNCGTAQANFAIEFAGPNGWTVHVDDPFPTVGASQSRDISAWIQSPHDADQILWTHQFFLRLSGGGAVLDSTPFSVDLRALPLADLSFVFVDVINPPSSYNPSSPIHLGYRIDNTGGSTSASGTVSFYLSTDTTITAGDRLLVTHDLPGIIAGGTASYETSPDPTLPANLPGGSYYVGGIINVSDANANNNTGYEPNTITVVVSSSCAPLCGAKLNVACLNGAQRSNSDAVGLMIYGTDTPWCTAWVFAAPDVMITNAHCVKPGGEWGCVQINPAQLRVRFSNECDSCQGGSVRQDHSDVGVNRILWVDDEHDFALLQMEQDVSEPNGVLSVSCEDLRVDDDCYLIHHASGAGAVVSQVMKGFDGGRVVGEFNNPGSNCPPGRTTTVPGVSYALWSKGGASGSPVFSMATNDVQAINNRGNEPTTQCFDSGYGIPMSLIVPVAVLHLDGQRLRAANVGCLMQVLNEVSSCFDGPLMSVPAECAVADLNGDRFVDLMDFSVLQNAFAE